MSTTSADELREEVRRRYAESALAGHFGISSIPTIALFEPGEQPKAVMGALPREMLESAFELDRFQKAG